MMYVGLALVFLLSLLTLMRNRRKLNCPTHTEYDLEAGLDPQQESSLQAILLLGTSTLNFQAEDSYKYVSEVIKDQSLRMNIANVELPGAGQQNQTIGRVWMTLKQIITDKFADLEKEDIDDLEATLDCLRQYTASGPEAVALTCSQ
eukprot:3822589-Rhodomonas_salina.2